ncbi:carbohydrate ABC transporter permease [Arthrobacter sp. 35W]|uniref:carbohydrate ABC transporter permease n=1 Tax=Arthrobacter sp. 35W TaxID=1132441 RepID=UPI000427EE0B|nr:sugar ABC transporter permease [Arthrobacter sp. 35W]
MSTVTSRPARFNRSEATAHTSGKRRRRFPANRRWAGWLFALPALAMYLTFVVRPVFSSVQYSFYDWNGIGTARWVGVDNYVHVLSDPTLLSTLWHAFFLIIFFTIIPVAVGLVVAAVMRDIQSKLFGGLARTLLFLPQIIPGAASAVAWTWMYSQDGLVNQFLRAIGLGDFSRAWLGDFTFALPAVGFIGTWLSVGLCTLLLMAGIGKIDPSLYEAARMDGASWLAQFRNVTLPGLRQEIGVCVTITVIAALASFDVVFIATQGGPGQATMVPGVKVYELAFVENRLGLASALAIVLTVLVLAVVGPLQRVFRQR